DEQVGLDLTPGLLLGELLDRAELAVARIVAEHAETAEVPVGAPYRLLDACLFGHDELQCQQALAVRCGEVLKRARVPCGSCDAVTALERRLRPYSAKAPRGTCDEPYPRHDGSSRSIAAGGRRSVDLSGRGHRKVVRLRAAADM